MKALYYIYRNLHTKTFSVQYKGKVVAHPKNFIANDCIFRVSELGRQRVLEFKRKNVHAKIGCIGWEEIDPAISEITISDTRRLYYNPYMVSQFQYGNRDILSASAVVGLRGTTIYVPECGKALS